MSSGDKVFSITINGLKYSLEDFDITYPPEIGLRNNIRSAVGGFDYVNRDVWDSPPKPSLSWECEERYNEIDRKIGELWI